MSGGLKYKVITSSLTVTTFESVCFTITGSATTVAVLLLYPPGSAVVTDVFSEELSNCLEDIAPYKCQIVIAGDFNIHMEIADDRHAIALRDLLASFDCIQQVLLQPTHRDGGTLDLVVTKVEQDVDDLTVDPPGVISDHSVIN